MVSTGEAQRLPTVAKTGFLCSLGNFDQHMWAIFNIFFTWFFFQPKIFLVTFPFFLAFLDVLCHFESFSDSGQKKFHPPPQKIPTFPHFCFFGIFWMFHTRLPAGSTSSCGWSKVQCSKHSKNCFSNFHTMLKCKFNSNSLYLKNQTIQTKTKIHSMTSQNQSFGQVRKKKLSNSSTNLTRTQLSKVLLQLKLF